ncbi:hypothetical protein NECAME_18612, partial [Necator americanus]
MSTIRAMSSQQRNPNSILHPCMTCGPPQRKPRRVKEC